LKEDGLNNFVTLSRPTASPRAFEAVIGHPHGEILADAFHSDSDCRGESTHCERHHNSYWKGGNQALLLGASSSATAA